MRAAPKRWSRFARSPRPDSCRSRRTCCPTAPRWFPPTTSRSRTQVATYSSGSFSPPAAVPTRSTPSGTGTCPGRTASVSRSRHRRTSSGRRLSSRRSAGSSPRRSRAQRLALPPQDGGRRARRAGAAIRAGLRPGPLGPELSRPLHHGAAGALSGGLRSSRRRIAFSQLLLIAPLPSRIRSQ